jgi:CheY-like chemotaxis protein
VSDTGVGIGKHELTKIYLPFYTTKDKKMGTGLGLSMAFNIIEKHKGFIDVYSEKNLGSSFNIFLPINSEHEVDSHSVEIKSKVVGNGVILIVDDDDSIRNTTKELLTQIGYEVLTASDGQEGIEVFTQHKERISAVILDMVMPKLSGKEVFWKMKTVDPSVKVILVSGFKQDERIQALMDMGITSFVQKPYTMEKITQILSTTLSQENGA